MRLLTRTEVATGVLYWADPTVTGDPGVRSDPETALAVRELLRAFGAVELITCRKHGAPA